MRFHKWKLLEAYEFGKNSWSNWECKGCGTTICISGLVEPVRNSWLWDSGFWDPDCGLLIMKRALG